MFLGNCLLSASSPASLTGLNTAFASLYCDDYEINVSNLVSVIAAASMLQLDGLLSKSAAAVEKHINNNTVSNLCQAASAYGYVTSCRSYVLQPGTTCFVLFVTSIACSRSVDMR